MFVALHQRLSFNPSQGMIYKKHCVGSFPSIFASILFLSFAFVGFCDEYLMVSVPLGFEISGSDGTRNWVSENGVFSFGFFEKMSNDYDGLSVGITYNLGEKSDNIPVWTVGGGIRVSSNSLFGLSMDGRLILLENPNGVIVWSSNTSNLGVQKATLLNNGNLVLMGVKDDVIWESFDKPTSTLLPGQSLCFPQTLRAPSMKSVSSYYSFVIRQSGELALMWENNVTYWRSHVFSSFVKEARFDGNGVLGLYGDTHEAIWHVSSKYFENSNVVLSHLRIDSDGNLRIYDWDDMARSWKVGWQAVENQCEVFGYCGLYSKCGYDTTGPVCDCLYSDSLNWDPGAPITDSGNIGCKQMVDLGNCKMHTSMIKKKQTVVYGMYPHLDIELMLSENACKEYCSNDTACVASTSKNDGSGLCSIKRTSFISGYSGPSVQATSFLKECLVPQAVSARGADPFGETKSIPKSSNRVEYRISSSKFIGAVALIVLSTVFFVMVLQFTMVLYIYRRRKVKTQMRVPFGKKEKMNPLYSFLTRLSFEEIQELTNKFNDQIGPYTYKGVLPNKALIIAKVLNSVIVSEKDFRVKISALSGMHHRNLVPLKGFCFEPKHKVILYEYIPKGSLDKWLFEAKQDRKDENWQQRLDIALGVARGIAYLHTECQQCVAHGNLKPDNVLLDENLVPKLTNFGIRSLVQKEVATSSESPSERDIFMLGEVLLQIVTCKRDTWGDNWLDIIDKLRKENKILGSDEWKEVERVVRIALWCMQNQLFLRPSIGEVVKVLEGTLSVDRPPSGHGTRRENETMSELEVEL